MSDVRNNPDANRFELEAGGHTALARYRLAPGVITFTHTEVPPALSGQGVGSKLARGALDQARAMGLAVVPQCEFIASFMSKHPEYADLLK